MHSCIYVGTVHHQRNSPVANEFHYRVFQMYVDLRELTTLFNRFWFWSARRPALAWFRARDHFEGNTEDLSARVQLEVERQCGIRPTGRICLLTNFRYYGYVINPVSYFYCFHPDTDQLQFVLAEVTNTPWGERHYYVLQSPSDPTHQVGKEGSLWTRKEFHVSPFLPMHMKYRWEICEPGERLDVSIENHWDLERTSSGNVPTVANSSQPVDVPFRVRLSLKRLPITSGNLSWLLIRHPFMTGKTAAAIYWQALRLWWKGVTFVPHPSRRKNSPAESESLSTFVQEPEVFDKERGSLHHAERIPSSIP